MGHAGHRLLFITDGSLDTNKLPPRVELLKVGSPLENVGFVAADMAFVPGSTNRLSLYYQVASTFREPKQFDLTLSRIDDNDQEQLFKVIPLTVAPGSNRPEIFQLQQAAGGRWIARLDAKDALADDNVAYLPVAKPDPISIAVDAADPFFLENSVQAFARAMGCCNWSQRTQPSCSPNRKRRCRKRDHFSTGRRIGLVDRIGRRSRARPRASARRRAPGAASSRCVVDCLHQHTGS